TGRFEAVWISIACSVIGIRNVPVHVLLSPRATSQVCPVSSVCRETPVCRRRVQPRKAGRFIYNMIRQACGHRWGALLPSRTNRTVADTLVQGQLPSQAHMRSADIIEGLKEDHPLPQALAVFAEARRLAPQRRQGL